jgi:hypothetical protein
LGRSLLRQASILLVLGGTAVLAAPALAAGPAPEPAPPRTNMPKPEPVPGTKRREPSTTTTTTRTSSTPEAPRQAAQPPAAPPSPPSPPPPPAPTQVFTPQPLQVAPPPPAPARRPPTRVQRPATKPKAKQKQARTGSTKQTKRVLPRVAPAATSQSSSSDTMLLIGGVALFILVLGDTLFLAFSARYLRGA